MTNFKRKLLAVVIACFVSAGAFAQKGKGDDKRPPKPDTKVVVEPKREKPPPNNQGGDKRNDGKKGRG